LLLLVLLFLLCLTLWLTDLLDWPPDDDTGRCLADVIWLNAAAAELSSALLLLLPSRRCRAALPSLLLLPAPLLLLRSVVTRAAADLGRLACCLATAPAGGLHPAELLAIAAALAIPALLLLAAAEPAAVAAVVMHSGSLGVAPHPLTELCERVACSAGSGNTSLADAAAAPASSN
jgi:hypothetical protein